MIEWRVNYPHSIWGKLRTLWHGHVLHHRCEHKPSEHGGYVVFDDTCQDAWWA